MKNSLVALLLIIAVLASGVVGYALATSGTTRTTTTTSENASTTTIFITRVATVFTTASSTTSTLCTGTGGLGCPHFFDQTYILSVNYNGPWGVSYQGYLGEGTSGAPVQSGNFYGHGASNESVTVSGTDPYAITICVEAQKLDASNSLLVLRILPTDVANQTSVPYGTTMSCLADVIM